jgi:hypothetical protein
VANSPVVPPADGSSGARLLGKTRRLILYTLLALLIVCVVFSWTTRGAMAFLGGEGKSPGHGTAQSLVDQQPWQTAQELAPLAVSAEENEYAREAERLADHEVDQAFASALRQARLETQRRTLTGDALALSQKVTQLEQLTKQDQALVDSMTAQAELSKGSASNGAQPSSTNDDLEVAKAQLGLDNDELSDAQREFERASGDHTHRSRTNWPLMKHRCISTTARPRAAAKLQYFQLRRTVHSRGG